MIKGYLAQCCIALLLSVGGCASYQDEGQASGGTENKGIKTPATSSQASAAGCVVPRRYDGNSVAVATLKDVEEELRRVVLSDGTGAQPTVNSSFLTVVGDEESRKYLICRGETIFPTDAGHRSFYAELVGAFGSGVADSGALARWLDKHPSPARLQALAKQSALLAQVEGEQTGSRAVLDCVQRAFLACMKRDPDVYGTPNQTCNDDQTHYMVRRDSKIEMRECYSKSFAYGDCVGACYRRGEATYICESRAKVACK